MRHNTILLITCVFCLSCVTPKVHNSLLDKNAATEIRLIDTEKEVSSLNRASHEFQRKIKALENQNNILRNDSIQNGNAYSALQEKYNELDETYELLASKNTRYIEAKAKETKKLHEELEQIKVNLFLKEDQLNKISDSLSQKRRDL